MRKEILILASAIILLCSNSCKKVSTSSTNQLPPLTTQGLNTFGCLVNGNLFIPQRPWSDPESFYGCFYQYIYADTSKPFVFEVWGEDKPKANDFTVVQIELDSIKLHQGDVFQLGVSGKRKKYGVYMYSPPSIAGIINYGTSDVLTGQIAITFLDQVNLIASGTFWFDAADGTGDTVHITQGRFDMHFTP